MFNNYENLINSKYYKLKEIFFYQEQIFMDILGYYPDLNKKYYSPFRSDKRPGCRFVKDNNILYFVDNRGYRQKLYFNCIEMIMYLEDISFKQALHRIDSKGILKPSNRLLFDSDTNMPESTFIPKIKFKYSLWEEDNYFSNLYKIDCAYLNRQPYYSVNEYWANTKKNHKLRKNPFGIKKHMIAYYFSDSKNTKLYFPDQDYRFHTNCNNDDIFGMHRQEEYLQNTDSIFLCSGGKDEMVLNYHTGMNTIARQTEVVPKDVSCIFSDKLMSFLVLFKQIYIWHDADYTGRTNSKHIEEYLKNFTNAKSIFHNEKYGKDIAKIVENNINLNKIIKNDKIL